METFVLKALEAFPNFIYAGVCIYLLYQTNVKLMEMVKDCKKIDAQLAAGKLENETD